MLRSAAELSLFVLQCIHAHSCIFISFIKGYQLRNDCPTGEPESIGGMGWLSKIFFTLRWGVELPQNLGQDIKKQLYFSPTCNMHVHCTCIMGEGIKH